MIVFEWVSVKSIDGGEYLFLMIYLIEMVVVIEEYFDWD